MGKVQILVVIPLACLDLAAFKPLVPARDSNPFRLTVNGCLPACFINPAILARDHLCCVMSRCRISTFIPAGGYTRYPEAVSVVLLIVGVNPTAHCVINR